VEQARAALQAPFEQERGNAPPQFRKELRMVVRPLRERQIGDMRLASWTLFGAVLVVLLRFFVAAAPHGIPLRLPCNTL
jgi:hypothetical protein